jgi:hypothetical protein
MQLIWPRDHPVPQQRRRVCETLNQGLRCPYLKDRVEFLGFLVSETKNQCDKCHCVLDIKWRLPVFHCPFGYW